MTAPARTAPPSEVVIGLDVGTTAVKAVAFGVGTAWRHTGEVEYPLLQPAPGHQVQDQAVIGSAVTAALAECAARTRGSRVLAVSVSAAMHGLIGLGRDMQPLTPLVTWADSRASAQARQLHESGCAADLHRTSGAPVHPMTPLTKLMWFRQEAPELFSRVRWWIGLKDHVLHLLTGALVTELSSASGTGLLDMSARDWSAPALDLAGITAEHLPRILPSTAVLELSAAAAASTGLPAGTPVVAGAADGPLANLGTGAIAPGTVALSLGTSGAVRTVVREPFADPHGRLFCYALTETAWVVGGAISNGGVVMRWAGDVFGRDLHDDRPNDALLLDLASRAPAGSDGLIMLPYLLAERAPLWDPQLRGAFLGVRHLHTREHFVRAAMEGVALQLSAIVADLDRLGPVTSVQLTGGAFRSALWRTVIAATLDRPAYATGDAEGSALGAAVLGLHALGRTGEIGAGLTLLGAAGEVGEPIRVAPADVRAYRRNRDGLAALLGSYRSAASLFS
ncbi:gluconokinase [Kitasatospora viridis]|uniref:Gluconate kinase (FGGY family) n=1 Tax=Kitasatospora viridis TaxID=281105 RepID=A0A561TWF0_9ACTN|nr:gluconokinase [Kitasatospora viridis]TWF91438.1 gluconate kinase (FGGY family) [Kitasatospora viridis]